MPSQTSAQTDLDFVMWVSATSREAILGGYTEAASQLGHQTPSGAAEKAAGWFRSWLQNTERSWLVVLDDLADPADLIGLWPDGPAGSTVVTTRRTDAALFGQGRRRITVGLFSPGEAGAYFVQKLGLDPDSGEIAEVDRLADELEHLPLALAQAATFMLDRGESCAGYRARLADQRRAVAELFPPDALADDYRATVAATWSISMDAADQLPPRRWASALLRVLSVLDPNGVPIEVVDTNNVLRCVRAAAGAHTQATS